jgi:hypothetical protein
VLSVSVSEDNTIIAENGKTVKGGEKSLVQADSGREGETMKNGKSRIRPCIYAPVWCKITWYYIVTKETRRDHHG